MAAESTKPKTLDEGGKNIVALMTALLVAIFAFQLNASMLSPALVAMQNELNTTATEIGNTQTVFFTAAALFSQRSILVPLMIQGAMRNEMDPNQQGFAQVLAFAMIVVVAVVMMISHAVEKRAGRWQ